MNTSVECPHVDNGRSDCPGCQTIDPESPPTCDDGEIEADVVPDSEGDAGVVYGIHHFLRVEDLKQTCSCRLTDAEQSKAENDLADNAAHFEPDASDDPRFPY